MGEVPRPAALVGAKLLNRLVEPEEGGRVALKVRRLALLADVADVALKPWQWRARESCRARAGL
eukprot:5757290-Prymnesium_polylepis.1